MYPTPTLWFEIGVAILLVPVFLWTKPEYSLFLYAFSLGFPDFAYPLGTTINIRLDDVLIVLFLARTICGRRLRFLEGRKAYSSGKGFSLLPAYCRSLWKRRREARPEAMTQPEWLDALSSSLSSLLSFNRKDGFDFFLPA